MLNRTGTLSSPGGKKTHTSRSISPAVATKCSGSTSPASDRNDAFMPVTVVSTPSSNQASSPGSVTDVDTTAIALPSGRTVMPVTSRLPPTTSCHDPSGATSMTRWVPRSSAISRQEPSASHCGPAGAVAGAGDSRLRS
jgi:hypothetical protein